MWRGWNGNIKGKEEKGKGGNDERKRGRAKRGKVIGDNAFLFQLRPGQRRATAASY